MNLSKSDLEEIRKYRQSLTPIQKLVDDLYWEYDRMTEDGKNTLTELALKVGLK